MDRICLHKATGRLIDGQSGGDDIPELMDARLDTLRQNAINAGYQESEIELKWVTPAERERLAGPTPEEMAGLTKKRAIDGIQAILDRKAKEFGFDTIHTAAVWTISKNPNRKARADALVAWGDKVWDFAEAEWANQEKGTPTYTDVESFLNALPAFGGVA